MKLIYTQWLPFKGPRAINFFGLVFVREGHTLPPHAINRQKIRTAQMRELWYVGFYILYFLEWVCRLVVYPSTAYRGISFEREAYEHQYDYDYLESRRPFAQWRSDDNE